MLRVSVCVSGSAGLPLPLLCFRFASSQSPSISPFCQCSAFGGFAGVRLRCREGSRSGEVQLDVGVLDAGLVVVSVAGVGF